MLGAGLMVRSFTELQRVEPGFEPHSLLSFRVALSWRAYRETEKVRSFHEQVLQKLEALPGVSGAALDTNPPFSGEEENYRTSVTLEGQSVDEQQRNPYLDEQRVSHNFFELMGIGLLRGRAFEAADGVDAPRVAMVGERTAARLWPGADPLGRRIKVGGTDSEAKWMTVVGVARKVKRAELAEDAGLDLYVSALQVPDSNAYFLVRTEVEPMKLADAARRVVLEVDPAQSSFDFRTMEERIARKLWRKRVSGSLFVAFAGLAAALAAVGIYGVMSYTVRQRTRELGIRTALGAQRSDLLRLVLGETLRLAAIGIGAGLLAGLALASAIEGLLYGVSVVDPLTFFGAPPMLLAVALVAALLPAWRAAKADPLIALRHE